MSGFHLDWVTVALHVVTGCSQRCDEGDKREKPLPTYSQQGLVGCFELEAIKLVVRDVCFGSGECRLCPLSLGINFEVVHVGTQGLSV